MIGGEGSFSLRKIPLPRAAPHTPMSTRTWRFTLSRDDAKDVEQWDIVKQHITYILYGQDRSDDTHGMIQFDDKTSLFAMKTISEKATWTGIINDNAVNTRGNIRRMSFLHEEGLFQIEVIVRKFRWFGWLK